MLSILPQLFDFQFYGPFILRLALASVLLAHGRLKIGKESRMQFAGWLESMGFRLGELWAIFVIVAEVGGGVLLLIGFLTQLATIVLIIEFLVIIFYVRRGQSFTPLGNSSAGSRELDFLMLMMLLALLILGPGAWAVDYPL